jgi:putative ABC transport system permease protein
MTRHLLRLIWNRRRTNFLIMLEIFFAFLVLFAVTVLALQMANNYRQPLGYDIDHVWAVSMGMADGREEAEAKPDRMATVTQMLRSVRELREIEAVCASFTGPYITSGWGSALTIRGRLVPYGVNLVTDDCQAVLHLPIVRGRWFSGADDGDTAVPIIANERFMRDLFGAAGASSQGTPDPLGQIIRHDDSDTPRRNGQPRERLRLVGVIPEFRQDGELSTPTAYVLRRANLQDVTSELPKRLLVRVRSGTPAEFEETLVRRLQAMAPGWSFETRPLVLNRRDNLRQRGTPLVAVAVIAGFLLLMVALGLTGVLWQNVTQRTREMGLRRAKGANAGHIQRQVLAELTLMTTLALLVAVALIAQLPLLPLPQVFSYVPGYVFFLAIGLAVAAMYLLTVACAWYPARLATRIQPADALHYE